MNFSEENERMGKMNSIWTLVKRIKEWGKGSTWLGKGGDDTIGRWGGRKVCTYVGWVNIGKMGWGTLLGFMHPMKPKMGWKWDGVFVDVGSHEPHLITKTRS